MPIFTKEQDWLDMVTLLRQAKHYADAIDILKQAIRAMPHLEATYKRNFAILEQDIADQMFEEVQLRRKSSQFGLAEALLRGFDKTHLSIETQLKIDKRLSENDLDRNRLQKILTLIREQHLALKDEAIQKSLTPILDEIQSHLSLNTLDRLVDYERLQSDAKLSNEQRLAYAVSGWVLGPGAVVDSLTMAKSMMEARSLVRDYIGIENPQALPGVEAKRKAILEQLRQMESGAPRYIVPLLTKILPP